MALTGTGIRIGTVTEFGVSVRFPRGLASDGTTLRLFDANKGYTLDLSTGIATPIGTLTNFGVSEAALRSATYHNNQFVFFGQNRRRIFEYDPSDGGAEQITAQLTIQGSSANPDIWGLASLDGTLWALERGTDKLYTVDIANDMLIPVGTATDFGLPGSPNLQSFTAYDGELIAISNGLQKLVRFDQTTGIATLAANGTVPDAASEALAEHAGQLFLAGSGDDALFRMYDVGWDETIAAVEVDEGSNGSLDLSTVSKDATSFEFTPGYTAPGWLTISGMDLTVTNAPDVTADTDFEAQVRAIRDSAHADKTLTVRVIAEAVPPPPLNPPTFTAPAANYEVNERADDSIDSTEFFTGHTRLAFRSGYSAPSWLTISGLNVVITDAPDVLEDTDFTVPLTATNNDGSVNGSITISVQQIDPAPVFGTPNRFDIDEGSSSVFDLSGDLQNTESLAYQSGYSAPSWLTISGLTLVITNAQQVSQDTDFDVLLAAESTKTAATADRTVTIRVRDVTVPPPPVTPPGAPTSLSLTKTHNSIVATWRAAANNGGEAPSRYDIQINGGGWIDAGLDLTHTFENLSPETQYTIDVVQVNSTGRGTPASKSVRTDAAPIVITTPGAPRSLSLTKTHNSIVARWAAAANNGGEAPSRYDVQINRGQWIDTGLDLRHTFENLLPETEYLIEVVQVNSAGRGTPASRRVRTDAAPTAPAAPQNLTVELTATTAILKWAISGTGSPADTYEVSYAEGDRVGSDWIDTKNLRTRFFIRRLKRATRYTFAVRGRNSEGAGDASRPVTQNTPIASLHNALFFKECVNYFDNGGRVSEYGNPSNIIRAVADNDYNTFTREKDLVINIAVGGNSTRVDAIFVKGIDIETHAAVPTGGSGSGYSNRVMPLTVKNWEGTEVSTVVAGFQHDLYLLDSHFTATSVRMMFTGTDAKIYEIMLLEFGLEINANSDFTQINPDFVDRSGVVHPDAGSGIAYSPSIGDQRDKWEIDYVVKVVPGKTLLETPEEFLYWRAKNKNHVFAMEPSRFPWRVFPAVFVRKRVPVRYRTDDKLAGEVLNFRVAEQ